MPICNPLKEALQNNDKRTSKDLMNSNNMSKQDINDTLFHVFVNDFSEELTWFNNWTALHLVARYGNADGIQMMLNVWEDDTQEIIEIIFDNYPQTPLHLVARYGSADGIRVILNALGSNAQEMAITPDNQGWTPLSLVTRYGSADALQEIGYVLGDNAKEIMEMPNLGFLNRTMIRTPLSLVAQNGNEDSMRYLVECGLNINTKTLHYRMKNINSSCVDFCENEGEYDKARAVYLYNQCIKHDRENTRLLQSLFDEAVRLKDYFVEHILMLTESLPQHESIELLQHSIAASDGTFGFIPDNYVSQVIYSRRGGFGDMYNPNTKSAKNIKEAIINLESSTRFSY